MHKKIEDCLNARTAFSLVRTYGEIWDAEHAKKSQ